MKNGIFNASKSHESLEYRLKTILRKLKTKKKHGKKSMTKTRKLKRSVKGRKVTLKEKKTKKKRGSKK
jgi:hypothetical protein